MKAVDSLKTAQSSKVSMDAFDDWLALKKEVELFR